VLGELAVGVRTGRLEEEVERDLTTLVHAEALEGSPCLRILGELALEQVIRMPRRLGSDSGTCPAPRGDESRHPA
jgi:hypothetical protein